MGLKSLESGKSNVFIPSWVRHELKKKGWTILYAIKNGINTKFRSPNPDGFEVYQHPEFMKILGKLQQCRIKLAEYEDEEDGEYEEDE